MKIWVLLISAFTLVSCANSQELIEKNNAIPKPKTEASPISSVKGQVKDEAGEPIFAAKIMLIQEGVVVYGALTDFDGNFIFKDVQSGVYDIEVNYIGYDPQLRCCIEVLNQQTINFELIEMEMIQIQTLKPIIYIYPETTANISVQLEYKGELTFTYPKYPEEGWNVTAQPDGTLHDDQGKEYYALFWEGIPTKKTIPTDGAVVSKDELIPFLEKSLDQLGLNRREANEFILFWLPMIGDNNFNLIHFSTTAYEDLAKLTITPKPESLIRVMMIAKPLNYRIDFPYQDLKPLERKRTGYTVVEWGGSVISEIEN